LFAFHDFGALVGLIVGAIPVGAALYLAVLAFRDLPLPLGDGTQVAARFIAPYAAAVALMYIAFMGYYELPAYSLSRQLAVGDATVTEGTVYSTAEGRGWECFSVGDQRFCYGNDLMDVGFHQTAASGGPIRDGLHVRVSSVGTVIVRLEIAHGQ
jgi:hypothetical protein